MPEKPANSLQERVERLEAMVAELQSLLKQALAASRPPEPKPTGAAPKAFDRQPHKAASPPASPSPPRPAKKPFALATHLNTSEYWLNKIGIGLLLFGVAFLFKYSIDQGWLTPTVRIAFGMGLGLGLVGTGLRLARRRQHFSQVLSGGGLAAFYITGFAAFQVFSLVSHLVAFMFMVAVTVLAFVLALKHDGAPLALIGALGGLGTPFLLYTGSGSLPGLVGYTCLVLIGTSAIYFHRGWRALLWISIVGGWLVFLIGLKQGLRPGAEAGLSAQWALQAGIIFGWLDFWLLPLLHEFVWANKPARRRSPAAESAVAPLSPLSQTALQRQLHLSTISTPLIALWMSMGIWSLSNPAWGWIALGGALIYGLASRRLAWIEAMKPLADTHALVGVLLLTNALYLLLDGDALLFALATEAAALHLIAHRLADTRVALAAHLLSGAVGLWLFERLFSGQVQGTALFNLPALTDLWVIAIAAVVALRTLAIGERKIYLLLLHIALMGWFLRELASLANGQGYVTIAWGVYAIALLVLGLRMNLERLRTVAMGTLLIVVGKLFLVDLAELETIWRVLLFLGFGGLFLLLSYYFRALWKPSEKPAEPGA